jgi:hypothetical protein
MDHNEAGVALIAQAVVACRTLAKAPPEAAITEFSYRILEDYPSMTFGDTQLFWRKFTAGELNDKAFSFAGPGLPEIMECWERFQMQRAGEFERKHEHRKAEGQKMTKEASEFYRAYIERANAEHEQRQQRRERLAKKNAEIKAHEGVVFTDYKRYLRACEDRGLTQEQGAGFLSYPQYLLDRQCIHAYLVA